MEEEKLSRISNAVCRELNFQLLRAGLLRIDCYVIVIISIFEYTFNVCSKGDKKEKIMLYENLLKLLNRYINDLKEKYENQREG